VQGWLSLTGSEKFEEARARLGVLSKWPVDRVSDADVIEYLARGENDTRAYLKEWSPEIGRRL
jgi:hypothetical protein